MKKRWERWVMLGMLSVILTAGMVSGTRYTVNAKEEQHGELTAENNVQSNSAEREATESTGETASDETEEKKTPESEGEGSESGEENEGETVDSEEDSETDSKASRITLTPSDPAVDNGIPDVWGYYNRDSEVYVDVLVEEEDGGSGIQKIEYWITDGTEEEGADVERQTLYEYVDSEDDEEGMQKDSAESSDISTDVENKEEGAKKEVDESQEEATALLSWAGTIPVDTAVFHTCDVAVCVKTTDCSGNESVSVVYLDIDMASPQVLLSFDNNDFVSTDSVGNTYFNKARTATIVITE